MKPELLQEAMINQVRRLCLKDERIIAALMYGSFTRGTADEVSDIEFYVFISDSEYAAFNPVEWIRQISPLAVYLVNDAGFGVAIFENLVRGEFRFQKMSEMPALRAFGQIANFRDIDAMLILDRTGKLREFLNLLAGSVLDRASYESVVSLYHNFLNAMLSGVNVLTRGERARALDLLQPVQRYLLWLARVHEGKLPYADTRSFRFIETELSESVCARYVECTGSLHHDSLERAYAAAWKWGKELSVALAQLYPLDLSVPLIRSLDSRFTAALEHRMEPN